MTTSTGGLGGNCRCAQVLRCMVFKSNVLVAGFPSVTLQGALRWSSALHGEAEALQGSLVLSQVLRQNVNVVLTLPGLQSNRAAERTHGPPEGHGGHAAVHAGRYFDFHFHVHTCLHVPHVQVAFIFSGSVFLHAAKREAYALRCDRHLGFWGFTTFPPVSP